jgi:hypothetical protein
MKRALYGRSELHITSHLRKEFRRVLNELWRKKAAQLIALFDPSPGRLPRLSRKWRDDKIDSLLDLAVSAHLPPLRRWVAANTTRKRVLFSRQTPKTEKAVKVKEKLENSWGHERHLVYASFAKGRKCPKVGRSDTGLNRIRKQRTSIHFCNASRVDVYFPIRRKKKTLPALECALTHLHNPVHRENRPASRKWREKCPACRDTVKVKTEVRKIFPA